MAMRGLRTLCIAYVDLSIPPAALTEDEAPEENLTLLGIVGIKVGGFLRTSTRPILEHD
jgi:magnesium-transporting ATPase (P-type)